ncbi:hypothetical protein D3C87_1665110 [compost metagenome]
MPGVFSGDGTKSIHEGVAAWIFKFVDDTPVISIVLHPAELFAIIQGKIAGFRWMVGFIVFRIKESRESIALKRSGKQPVIEIELVALHNI